MSRIMGAGSGDHYTPGMDMLPEQAWVYILMGEIDGEGFMKIGCSSAPVRRWKILAKEPSSCDFMPHVSYAAVYKAQNIRKSYQIERLLHFRFRNRKISGEWYRFDFKNPEDKKEFNDGCRQILEDGWWEKFNFSIVKATLSPRIK